MRDLGIDAHLILFKNDGFGGLSHFVPENDTWNIEKWKPYIHHSSIFLSFGAVLGHKFPYNLIFLFYKIYLRLIANKNHIAFETVKQIQIEETLIGYDIYIGSGLSGALLAIINRKLNIFYPYAMGIEYFGDSQTMKDLNKSNLLKRTIISKMREIQSKSIKNAKNCISAEMSITKKSFEKLLIKQLPFAVPMVYNREQSPDLTHLNIELKKLINHIGELEFSILTHSRQYWKIKPGFSEKEWNSESKHSDWLFRSFAKFIKLNPLANSKIIAVEYGEDVKETKQLCESLGISKNVIWISKMSRKEIMLLIEACDICSGEFYLDHGVIWGGTGWEVFSIGKPFLQGFRFEKIEFEEMYGYPPPPLLEVKCQDDIFKHLFELYNNPQNVIQIGIKAKDWFNKYNGIELANRWSIVAYS